MLLLKARRADTGFVVSLAVMAATLLTAVCQHSCPHTPRTGGLNFTDKYPPQPVVEPAGTFSVLSCCTGSQPDVSHTWYMWMKDSWCLLTAQSECGRDNWPYRHTSEDGQAFVFEDSDSIADSGTYLCFATDGQSTINRTFTLLVVDCRTDPKDITFSAPSDAQTAVGRMFSQACQGDFGCNGAVDSSTEVWWSYLDEDGHRCNLSTGKHGHYIIQESISRDKTKKTATLTIDGVREEDFHRLFVCSLYTASLPPAGFNLTLSQIENDEVLRRFIPLIVGLSVLVILVAMTALLTYWMCGSVVAFKWKSATSKLPQRGAGHEYDAMVLAGEEDEEGMVTRTLKSTLQRKGYKVYASRPERSEGKQIDDIEQCVTVIFIISSYKTKSYEDEKLAGFSRYFSVCAESNTNVVLIATHSLPDVEWQNMSRDYKKVYNNIPKLCTIVKWPESDDSLAKLKRKNFWAKVQSQLPPARPAATEREADSSNPLLTTQRSPSFDNLNKSV